MSTFTVSLNGSLVKATSVGRSTVPFPVALGVGDLAESFQKELSLASPTTNYAVAFDTLTTARVLLITSDQDITVKLNAESTGTVLKKNGVLVLMDVQVTALSITNSSGNTANVTVYGAGTA